MFKFVACNVGALLLVAQSVGAQYILSTATGLPADSCSSRTDAPESSPSSWAWTVSSQVRYVTGLPKPTTTQNYAKPYGELSGFLGNASSTTWGSWLPGETAVTADNISNPVGTAAWQQLWINANLTNYTTIGLYSTTVSPTPIPTTELIAPPPNYFGPQDCYSLPDDFVYGAAGAAGQIEGAIGLEGRTPGILEAFVTNGTGDNSNYVTDEAYMLYKQDIARLAAAGMKYYSFSISWTRILPFALANTPVNEAGIKHYDDVINTILEHGMEPIVTIHHFDSPYYFVDTQYPERSYQARTARNATLVEANPVQNKTGIWRYNGGFAHPDFVDAFDYYSKVVLTHYADRVPIWITLNSPFLWGNTPEGMTNSLKAHAKAYRFYKEKLKGQGQVGMKIGVAFPVPANPLNATHVDAAQRYLDMYVGALASPVMLGRQYPSAYTDTIDGARLLSDDELSEIGHTADFFAINEYTAQVVTPPPGGIDACAANSSDPYWPFCVVTSPISPTTGWALGNFATGTATNIPQLATRSCLNYLWNTYKLPIIISEFGFPIIGEANAGLPSIRYDFQRSEYYLAYLSEMLKAMYEDGVRVIGALAWAACDNWEFGSWTSPYGLQYLNRTTQERYYKKSFFDFVEFFESRMSRTT